MHYIHQTYYIVKKIILSYYLSQHPPHCTLHNIFMLLSFLNHSFTYHNILFIHGFVSQLPPVAANQAATTRNPYCTFTHSHCLSTSLYPLIRSLHSQRSYRTSPNLKQYRPNQLHFMSFHFGQEKRTRCATNTIMDIFIKHSVLDRMFT